jgi:hypothetical protein
MSVNIGDLRAFAVARSLFAPTTLKRALDTMGFVQADPIRAPARAQDLILRHRVKNYRAGDLDLKYQAFGIAEDFFINYGFVTPGLQALMHPRSDDWPGARKKRAATLLEFVRERDEVHPREVDAHFSHGKVTNYWGGSSNATTHLLDAMHYRGLLRVTRREAGIRLYAAHTHEASARPIRESVDTLVDVAVRIYAPLPGPSLKDLIRRLRFAAPQWHGELKGAFDRAIQRLAGAHVDGVTWYWPVEGSVRKRGVGDTVRLLAPFDPVVWDRARFELLWGWAYRFEAYTPVAKRVRGYYALPLLWRDRVIGWGNLSVRNGRLTTEFGYIASEPRGRDFRKALDEELERMREFLRLD